MLAPLFFRRLRQQVHSGMGWGGEARAALAGPDLWDLHGACTAGSRTAQGFTGGLEPRGRTQPSHQAPVVSEGGGQG